MSLKFSIGEGQRLVMSNTRRVFWRRRGRAGRAAGLLGCAWTLGTCAFAGPPPPAPLPPAPPPVGAAVGVPVPLSPAQQASARSALQRAALHRQAQAAEREAVRVGKARQFDQAQRSYGRAASLYHQQARLARQAAQDMAHLGQMGLAARAHAEALAADNRYVACLAGEVSAIKKSSLAEAPLPKRPSPAKPAHVFVRALPPAPLAKPVFVKHVPRPVQARPLPVRIAALPPPTLKPRAVPAPLKHVPKIAYAKPAPRAAPALLAPGKAAHMARARKALLPALKALRLAAAHPFKFTAGFIAARQHGQLQEMLRLRRAQLERTGAGEGPPASPSLP